MEKEFNQRMHNKKVIYLSPTNGGRYLGYTAQIYTVQLLRSHILLKE